jgi:hypothetical protein
VIAMPAQRDDYDLEIEVSADSSETPWTRIVLSPVDRSAAPFVTPYAERLTQLLKDLEHNVIRDAWQTDGVPYDEPVNQIPELRELGSELFAALFPGSEEKQPGFTIRESLNLQRRKGCRLRIRLSFEPEAKCVAAAEALPWEALFDPVEKRHLTLEPFLPFVRYLDVSKEIRSLRVPGNIRVLIVAPESFGTPPGQVRDAEHRIFKLLRDEEGCEVECVYPPTWEALREKLADKETHVLHYLGHGGFATGSSQGGVDFQDPETGARDFVFGAEMCEQLSAFPSLRLVTLISCRTGALRHENHHEPFRGAATALVQAGIPAVVGMQYSVSFNTVMRFSRAFYRHLLETGQVDDAVAEGRLALWNHAPSSLEWLAPVLFCRTRNATLFNPKPEPEPEGPAQIGIRSRLGWGLEAENKSDAFLSLTSFFREGTCPAPAIWQDKIYPILRDFIHRATAGERAVDLHLAAHKSLAFATGYLLEAKAGVVVGVEQRGATGTATWRITDPKIPDAGTWSVEEIEFEQEGPDIALVVSTSRPILGAVRDYLATAVGDVGRLVHFQPPGGPSQLFIGNGHHAFRLAEEISNQMYHLSLADDTERTFHLFLSGPNGLALSLGRLCRGARRIQLYEFDFEGQASHSYYPSLSFGLCD